MGDLKRKDNSIVFRGDKGNVYIPVEGMGIIFFNEVSLNTVSRFCIVQIVIHF